MHAGEIVAGRFGIEALAGSGGMADVYRARDSTTHDLVALKILRTSGPEDLARLAREAQALTRLSHPGVVKYVAHGTSDSNDAFVAMEWIEGPTLSKTLKRGPLPLALALKLGRALALSLAHAHEHGIIHRDVKPGNVILRNDDIEDPVLVDFGVARTGLAVGLTQLGTVIGTPRYMAPEQARGGQTVDMRADVFALGALMFKCITGHAPFDGEDAIAVLAHLLFDATPDVCAIVPNVPRAVGDLLEKMLAKEPSDRYADCTAVVRAIDLLDTSEIHVTVAVPAPSGLTLRERRLLSLMVLTGKVDANVARAVAGTFGARAEGLANGSVVVVVSGRDNATELARVSARCALELRRVMPEAPIVLATGRGEDRGDDATETMSDDASGSTGTHSRYSGVFERAAVLLRHEDGEEDTERPLPIVIDDTTAGLLGADFDVTRRQGSSIHALRGGGTGARAQYTLLGKPTPFVGRTRELATLLATWADVCEQDVARAMLIVGDAGLGKSRLLYELFEQLKTSAPPALLLRAKADATIAGSPFVAIGAAVRRELGISDDEPIDERWAKLAARVGSVVDAGEHHVAEFIAEVIGLRIDDPGEQVAAARRDPRLMGDRIRRSWQAWIRGEAAHGPVLIVLEDFQWGDLPTVKLVDDMLVDLAESPIFVLALARPEIDAAFPNVWSRVVERMPLIGLSKKAGATFVRSMLERDDAAVERIVALASGNALHLEELVRASAEGKIGAPESLLAILSTQVESLPDAERRVLRAASVFGSTFSTDGVCVLLAGAQEPNERVRAETNTRIDALAQHEIVSERGSPRSARQRELEFRNTLVRDVTYAMLTDDDRRLGHALAADWLERVGGADPFVLAEHRERGDQADRAIAHYVRSASTALDAGDFATAIERIERAKRCHAEGTVLAEALLIEAEAHRWRGETRECSTSALAASERAKEGTVTYFRALRLMAYAASFGGDVELMARVTAVVRDAMPLPDAKIEWLLALMQVLKGLNVTGQVRDKDDLVRLFEEEARAFESDVDVSESLRLSKSLTAYQLGDFSTMVDAHSASARVREELGDDRGLVMNLSNLAFAAMWMGDHVESTATFERSREIARRCKLATLELNAMQNLAFLQFCAGDDDATIRASREILARAEIEAPRLMALAHLCIARAALRQGDRDRAEHEARAGVAAAPMAPIRMYAHAVLADVVLALGQVDDAITESDRALALLTELGNVLIIGDLYAFVVRAEALHSKGDVEAARKVLARAQRMYDERRAFLRTDAARATYDAHCPERDRLLAATARLAPTEPT